MNSRANKIFSGAVWGALVNIVNAIYGFIAAPLLISYFGKSDYGLIGLASSINGYMALMDMGLNSTNVRFFSVWLAKGDNIRVKKLMQSCTAFYCIVGLINSLVLITVYFYTDKIFNITPEQDVILKQILIVLSCMAVVNWYTSCFGQLISATENVAWVQKRNLATKVLMVVVLFLTIKYKFTLIQYVLAFHCVGLLILPATIRKVLRVAPFVSFMAKFDWKTFKEILPYSLNIFSFSIFQFSFFNLRTVFLGMQSTPAAITEYNVMNSLVGLAGIISGIFMGTLLPSSSRVVAQGDTTKYYQIAYQGTKFISVSLCFCSFGLMTIDYDLIMVYVGSSFRHLIPWLNIWLFFLLGNHNQCISSLILAGADVRAISRISAFSSVIGLVAAWFLIPYYGAGGPVLALCAYTTSQILFYWIYYWPKKMNINSWKVISESLLPYIIIGGAITGILTYIPHFENHWYNIFIFGSTFVVLYLILTYILFNKEDKAFIQEMIKR